MKLITRNTDYAIRALCRMGGPGGGLVSASELVRTLKIPRPFLRKLLQSMHKKGLLESARGRGGGFRLARPPGQIYLYEVMETFQGEIKINECLFRKHLCPDRKDCKLKAELDAIEKSVISRIKSITIASIMG